MISSIGTIAFGTAEKVPRIRRLTAGPLSAALFQGAVRSLCWHGVEVVRAIDCLVRSESWATCPALITDEHLTGDAQNFRCVQHLVIADGALSCHLSIVGRSDGFFRASAELIAHREFRTNRAGFIVLHPLSGLTGSALTVRRGDGSITSIEIPKQVSPRQLAFDITGLEYRFHGIETRIDFIGDVFEMEDQRNWSDGSYKTYCRPLSRPIPYVIAAGETVRQEIEIKLAGIPAPRMGASINNGELQLAPADERVPVVALLIDRFSIPDEHTTKIARDLSPRLLQLHVDIDTAESVLASARDLVEGCEPQIELGIVVPRESQPDQYLAHIAERCKHYSIDAARVLALPEAYLKSFQPDGPWPGGPTLQDACAAARERFPSAQIGGGVLTHFAEFNRCRPDLRLCDYVSHGSTAIVHAADDCSVVESLEGLSCIYASGHALAGERDYRLGLVSIGMRYNPYGSDVAPNPEQIRVPMARIDPRQRGLFAAAWSIGAIAHTDKQCVSSLALASITGPFGIIYRRAAWPQPLYDETPDAKVYPLFHVIRALQEIAGLSRLSLRGTPNGVVGIAAQRSAGARLLLANLAEEPRNLTLPELADVRRLDAHTFQAATRDPGWLRTAAPERRREVALGPFNVAFVDFVRSAA